MTTRSQRVEYKSHDREYKSKGRREVEGDVHTITVIQNFTKARITTCHLSRRDNDSLEFHRVRLPVKGGEARKTDFESKNKT